MLRAAAFVLGASRAAGTSSAAALTRFPAPREPLFLERQARSFHARSLLAASSGPDQFMRRTRAAGFHSTPSSSFFHSDSSGTPQLLKQITPPINYGVR